MGCIPMFQKPERVSAFIIGDDANNLLMVTIPSILQVPIFELHCGAGGRPIEEQVQELLEALLDAAKFELCTNDTEPAGAFYGLVQSHLRVLANNDREWVEVVNLGIAFSESELIPQFGADPMGFYYHRMDIPECQAVGLPTFEVIPEPEPEVNRPTRFEREDVI